MKLARFGQRTWRELKACVQELVPRRRRRRPKADEKQHFSQMKKQKRSGKPRSPNAARAGAGRPGLPVSAPSRPERLTPVPTGRRSVAARAGAGRPGLPVGAPSRPGRLTPAPRLPAPKKRGRILADRDTLGARNTTAFGNMPALDRTVWTGPTCKKSERQLFRLTSSGACGPRPSAGRKRDTENGGRPEYVWFQR